MELTLRERQKFTAVTAKKYRKAKKSEKSKILDVFTEQTVYGRKYAVYILANDLNYSQKTSRGCRPDKHRAAV